MQASTQHRHTLIPIDTRTNARTQARAKQTDARVHARMPNA